MEPILVTLTLVVASTAIALVLGIPWGLSLWVFFSADKPMETELHPVLGWPRSLSVQHIRSFMNAAIGLAAITSLILLVSLPLYIHAIGWESFLGKFTWLGNLGNRPRFWFSGLLAASWIHGTYGACWVALSGMIGLRRIPPAILDAAQLSLANRWTVVRIVLPVAAPWFVLGALWSAGVAATEMSVADLYLVRTLADEVYKSYAIDPSSTPVLMAALLPPAIIIPMLMVILRKLRHTTLPVYGEGEYWGELRWGVNRSGMGVWAVSGLLFVMLIATVPLAAMIRKAGWEVTGAPGELRHRFSANTMMQTLVEAPSLFAAELQWSLLLGALAMVVAVPLGALAAAMVEKVPSLRPAGLWSMVLLGLIPGPVVSVGVIEAFNRPVFSELYDYSLVPTLCTLLPRGVPASYFVMRTFYRQQNQAISDAVKLEGGTLWLRTWWLYLPRAFPAWMLAGTLVFFVAIADVSATILVLPPSVSTVAVRLFGLFHSGVRTQEAGLSLVTMILISSIIAAALCLLRYRYRWVMHQSGASRSGETGCSTTQW